MSRIRKLLLATDLSTVTDRAVECVTTLASQMGAELHILHVVGEANRGSQNGASPAVSDDAKAQLDRLVLKSSLSRLNTVCAVRIGRPAAEIVAYANEHEIGLIAMGTRARGHMVQALLGSVAEQVVRNAACPVLVIPPTSFRWTTPRLTSSAKLLSREFGPGVVGQQDEARSRMVTVLCKHQDLTEAEAKAQVDALAGFGVLTWHDGTTEAGANSYYWSIHPDSMPPETVEPATSDSLAEPETTAALDLIRRATALRATDIHMDPLNTEDYEVRLRIDGRIEHYCNLSRGIAIPIIQQCKLLANLDVTDPFRSQEGRLNLPTEFAGHEIRVTTAAVDQGPAMALRLFGSNRLETPLESLGLTGESLEAVERMLGQRSGLVLVTGPTGSGKTTTIYSLLKRLTANAQNIISIEDPVEYRLPFVRQIAVDARHGTTMTSGLKTILRMDPDIIFLGEIRDGEAAEIAMRAASAGRFVISTLHTRDVASTVTALRDLHIDNRSLAGNISGIIAQRLVRRLCPACSQARPITDSERALFDQAGLSPPAELKQAVGCTACRQTGYYDRVGLYEAVALAGTAADAIVEGVSEAEFSRQLRASGAASLLADGLRKAASGVTTVDEVLASQSFRTLASMTGN
ncbi:MAG TPA: ATPase, T2SS/T4P/T4SS family [Planctomycetaceae bacterium]|nr:ATPase, T2SS/T4P/T4SS family [Planctomycetaceae bacterium]